MWVPPNVVFLAPKRQGRGGQSKTNTPASHRKKGGGKWLPAQRPPAKLSVLPCSRGPVKTGVNSFPNVPLFVKPTFPEITGNTVPVYWKVLLSHLKYPKILGLAQNTSNVYGKFAPETNFGRVGPPPLKRGEPPFRLDVPPPQ